MIKLNFLKTFLNRIQIVSSDDPTRNWLMLLIIFSISLVSIFVWNAWAFDTVAGGGVIGSQTIIRKSVFNKSSLNAIHTTFKHRATEEEKYISGAYRFADPSN